MKTFGNWPTYPQLYAQGELIGGCGAAAAAHPSTPAHVAKPAMPFAKDQNCLDIAGAISFSR